VIATSTVLFVEWALPKVQLTAWSKDLRVTGDGSGVASHAGAVLLRLLADRVGLTQALSAALTRRRFWPVHDRGRVLPTWR
jgi:hypothetical protein